jgi:hypothetical protein
MLCSAQVIVAKCRLAIDPLIEKMKQVHPLNLFLLGRGDPAESMVLRLLSPETSVAHPD